MPAAPIAIINESTVVSDQEVAGVAYALQMQVNRDFAPSWGIDANILLVARGYAPPPNHWWLVILNDADQANALGYHQLTAQGLPLAKVFARTVKNYGLHWSVTASHELLEMLGDPSVNLSVLRQQTATSGTLYAYENCDPCESEQFAYPINNILVSDFVYPTWFQAFRTPGSIAFDYMKKIQAPFQLLPGGYIPIFQIYQGSGWTQMTAGTKKKAATVPLEMCRNCTLRGVPESKWKKSNIKKKKATKIITLQSY